MAGLLAALPSVPASAAAFWVAVGLAIVANKRLVAADKFPYPVAAAGLQLALVSLALGAHSVASHALRARRTPSGAAAAAAATPLLTTLDEMDDFYRQAVAAPAEAPAPPPVSWVFDANLLFKLRWVSPVGFVYGLFTVTATIGLWLVDAETHVLLASTTIVWALVFARLVNKEPVAWAEAVCGAGAMVGSFLLAVQAAGAAATAGPGPVLVNLLAPALLGLAVAMLRQACVALGPNGLAPPVGSLELTALKDVAAALTALAVSVALEGPFPFRLRPGQVEAWWTALWRLARDGSPAPWLLGGCTLLQLVFNCEKAHIASLTNARTLGLIMQARIVPAAAIAAALGGRTSYTPLNVAGGALCLGSCVAYVAVKYRGSGAGRAG